MNLSFRLQRKAKRPWHIATMDGTTVCGKALELLTEHIDIEVQKGDIGTLWPGLVCGSCNRMKDAYTIVPRLVRP